jgi:hypothetical protein
VCHATSRKLRASRKFVDLVLTEFQVVLTNLAIQASFIKTFTAVIAKINTIIIHSTMASEIPTKRDLNNQVSVLDHQDDPFAPREGKTLIWKDVNMTLVCVCYANATSPLSFLVHCFVRLNLTDLYFLCSRDVSSFGFERKCRLAKAKNRNASC